MHTEGGHSADEGSSVADSVLLLLVIVLLLELVLLLVTLDVVDTHIVVPGPHRSKTGSLNGTQNFVVRSIEKHCPAVPPSHPSHW